MKFLIACLLLSFHTFSQDKISLPEELLSFTYQSFDGQIVLKCKHKVINEWGDWDVKCGEKDEKIFSVHLLVNKYTRPRLPRNSFEILYWITDRKTMEAAGATTWLHLNDETSLHSINASQSTQSDTAGLYLTIQTPK